MITTGFVWFGLLTSGSSDYACAEPPYTVDECTIASVMPRGGAASAGLRPGDVVHAVDGRSFAAYLSGVPGRAGGLITLTITRARADGQPGDVVEDVPIVLQSLLPLAVAGSPPATFDSRLILLFLVQQSLASLVYLGVPVVVALARPTELAARLLLLSCGSFAFFVLGQGAVIAQGWSWLPQAAPERWWVLGAAWVAQDAFTVLGLPALLHLFLTFPVAEPIFVKARAFGPPPLRRLGGLTLLLYMVPLAVVLLGMAAQTATMTAKVGDNLRTPAGQPGPPAGAGNQPPGLMSPSGPLAGGGYRDAVPIGSSGSPLSTASLPQENGPVGAAVPTLTTPIGPPGWTWLLQPGMLLAALGALIRSYRQASTTQARAQVKWILWALAVLIVVEMPLAAIPFIHPDRMPGPGLTWVQALLVTPLAWGLFPLAIGLAILRYRLFDIDLLINRTVVYGVLAALLAGLFLVVSTLLQRALEDVTGQRSDLVTTGAALLVALAFQPLRRLTRALVDRVLPPRQLLTLLFADIVGSTERLVQLGDERWRELLGSYRVAVRRELKRYRGHEVDTAGDGFFVTFDSPLRAVRCAQSIVPATHQIGLAVRVGLHVGEVEMRGEAVSGLAVHTAARVMALAGANEIIASDDVRDALADDAELFGDRGTHVLKGVPGERQVYSISSA